MCRCEGVRHRRGRTTAGPGMYGAMVSLQRSGRAQVGIGAPRAEHACLPQTRARDSGPAGPRARTLLHVGGRTSHPADPSTSRPPAQRTAWRREPGVSARGRRCCPRGDGRAPDMGTPGGLDLGGWHHAPCTGTACPGPAPADARTRSRPATSRAAAMILLPAWLRDWRPLDAPVTVTDRWRHAPRGHCTAPCPHPLRRQWQLAQRQRSSRLGAHPYHRRPRHTRGRGLPVPGCAPPSPQGHACCRRPGPAGFTPPGYRRAASSSHLRRGRRPLVVRPDRCGQAPRPRRCRGRRHLRRAGRGPRPPAH